MRIKTALFVIAATVAAAAAGSAQTRTVTNADLAKYREARIAAERELRENYRELGFPSPEELERRSVESARQLSELAAKLRTERLAEESAAVERERNRAAVSAGRQAIVVVTVPGQQPYFVWSYVRPPWPPWPQTRGYQQPGYVAGGQFWPTGPRTPSQPLFMQGRR